MTRRIIILWFDTKDTYIWCDMRHKKNRLIKSVFAYDFKAMMRKKNHNRIKRIVDSSISRHNRIKWNSDWFFSISIIIGIDYQKTLSYIRFKRFNSISNKLWKIFLIDYFGWWRFTHSSSSLDVRGRHYYFNNNNKKNYAHLHTHTRAIICVSQTYIILQKNVIIEKKIVSSIRLCVVSMRDVFNIYTTYGYFTHKCWCLFSWRRIENLNITLHIITYDDPLFF